MMLKILSTSMMATCAAAVGILFAQNAYADEPNGCNNSGTATVCQSPGNSQTFASPPVEGGAGGAAGGGANVQNGTYGPAGDLPPVGGR